MEDKFKANAELVIEQLGPLSGLEFGYTAESVAWVDQFIEQQRSRFVLDENAISGLVDTLGSFLGESIIRCFGGAWRNFNEEWCVCFDAENMVFPFSKVQKQFTNGQTDSIKSFFELIPVLFKRNLPTPEQSPVPGNMDQLEFFIRQAEEAYSSIYDIPSSSGRAAAYSDCKESMYEAIQLARQLGLENKVIELEKKLEHYKAVFRSQLSS